MKKEEIIDEFLDIVLPMIVEEIVIAQKEGTPTSRLTSLYMKLVNIQHKIYD